MQLRAAAGSLRGARAVWIGLAGRNGRKRVAPAAILVYLVFFLLIGLPLALVLVQAVMPGLFDVGAPSLALSLGPLKRALASPRVLDSIVHSLALAVTSAVTATILGAAFAFVVQRCNVPGRAFIAAVPWLVFLTPSYLKALAWVLLMSPGGYLAQFDLLTPAAIHGFFSLPGLIFVQTLSLFPLATFIIGGALAGLGSDLEDAARLAGAPPAAVWLKINLPLLAPAIALTLIAIFAEVLSDFGMATTIARTSSYGVLTYGIYAAASDYPVDFPLAGSQALVLLMLVVAVVLADRLLRRRADPRLISGRSRPARIYDLGAWRWPAAGAALAISTLALLLPVAAILARAITRILADGLTAANLTAVNLLAALSPGTDANAALVRSLGFAGLAALLACAGALVLSVELDRSRRVMRPLVLGLSLGAVAIPGIVLGFGYILMWNRLPGFRDLPFLRYGNASLLVTGYVATALPYCLVILLAAIGQLAPSLADAARLQGVGAVQRLLKITLPLVFFSLVTAFLLTFIRTMFELPVSQMLIPSSGPPMPPLVINLFGHDRDGIGSALSLASMVGAGGGAAIVWLLARQFMAPRGGIFGSSRDKPPVPAAGGGS